MPPSVSLPEQFGRYRILRELGRGGMGAVYLADDTVLGRKVALKVVATGVSDPAAAERMLREARIIARLEHPGIVPVHDAGALPDGRVFYAMKRVDGSRLDALAPGMPLAERLRVFQRVCDAVAFAHAHGVIHRDLKPSNVMVGRFGEVLVMDWGIAKLRDSIEPQAVGERAGFVDGHDPGMIELRGCLRLGIKPLPISRRGKLPAEDHLDRHFAA